MFTRWCVLGVTVFVLAAVFVAPLPCWSDDSTDLFNGKCGQCHATDGSGKTPAAAKLGGVPDLRAKEIRAMSDQELYDSVANGTKHRKYPHAFLYTGLSRDQIQRLVAHIRALK